jgi:hypothetical protein
LQTLSKKLPNMKSITPKLVSSLTPIFIATIGGIIGVTVLVTNSDKNGTFLTGIGLAGTAIAGIVVLAQSDNSESTASDRNPKLGVKD